MIKPKTVYVKSENKDLAINTFGIVKPKEKEFVEFVTKKEGYFFNSEELKQLLSDVMKHASNFPEYADDEDVNKILKRWDKYKKEYIKKLLNEEK